MPRRDKTGPAGKGPMTGGGMGSCNVSNIAGKISKGIDSAVCGRGSGRGPRDGRGRGNYRK